MSAIDASVTVPVRRHDIRRELRLLKSWPARLGVVLYIVAAIAVPLVVASPFWSSVITLSGISAIGAIGLNISMGYTGQLSLGHSAFLAIGAYAAAATGQHQHWPLILWLLLTAAVTGGMGVIVGLFALRLRGPYLAIVTIGLVFIAIYAFSNWTPLTGGINGESFDLPTGIFGVTFSHLSVGGHLYTRDQGYGVLVWLLVGIALLITANLVRSGFGRAMLAVREQDIAAEVLGVRIFRTKVFALAIGSAMAGVAGALTASELQFVLPTGWDLNMSIQFVAMIAIGGMGTIWGPVLGAIFVTVIPQLVNQYADSIPLVKQPGAPGFGVPSDNAGLIIYGVIIVLTLLVVPSGIAGLGRPLGTAYRRAKSRLAGHH